MTTNATLQAAGITSGTIHFTVVRCTVTYSPRGIAYR